MHQLVHQCVGEANLWADDERQSKGKSSMSNDLPYPVVIWRSSVVGSGVLTSWFEAEQLFWFSSVVLLRPYASFIETKVQQVILVVIWWWCSG